MWIPFGLSFQVTSPPLTSLSKAVDLLLQHPTDVQCDICSNLIILDRAWIPFHPRWTNQNPFLLKWSWDQQKSRRLSICGWTCSIYNQELVKLSFAVQPEAKQGSLQEGGEMMQIHREKQKQKIRRQHCMNSGSISGPVWTFPENWLPSWPWFPHRVTS